MSSVLKSVGVMDCHASSDILFIRAHGSIDHSVFTHFKEVVTSYRASFDGRPWGSMLILDDDCRVDYDLTSDVIQNNDQAIQQGLQVTAIVSGNARLCDDVMAFLENAYENSFLPFRAFTRQDDAEHWIKKYIASMC